MQTTSNRQISARRVTILVLLRAKDAQGREAQPISGNTRMQKLIFLVSEKVKSTLTGSSRYRFDFGYEPEKFGPADLDLYQDLDFLSAMGLITYDGSQAAEPSEEPEVDWVVRLGASRKMPALLPEEREEEELSFEYLIGSDPLELLAVQAETQGERQYCITSKGLEILNEIGSKAVGAERQQFDALQKACQEVRKEFGHLQLKRLLKHVYDEYPSLTRESTILDQVHGTG